MKKSLILYCINLLRHCPDPWGTGGAPCRMGFPIDGGRQAGMCGIPCNRGSFRAASVLSRAGMFLLCCEIWQRSVIPPSPAPGCSDGLGPIVAGCPASFRNGTFPGLLLSRRHGWGIPTQNRRARFRWEFHISSGEVQQLIHRGSLLV